VDAAVSCRREIALFYALDAGRLVLAPSLRALIDALPAPPPLSIAKLADLLVLEDAPDTTVCEGARRLPLGHRLAWRRGQAQPSVHRWFDPSQSSFRGVGVREAAGVMRETVRAAVEASLPDDGSAAATLSGGLDSSMVTATAASLLSASGRSLPTVTHVPLAGAGYQRPNWEADDGPYARRMAADVPGLVWSPIVNDDRVLPLDAAISAFPSLGMPVLNPANQVWLNAITSWAADRDVAVMLAGFSGNASFSRARDGILAELLNERRLGAVVRQVARRWRAGDSRLTALRSVARETAPEWVIRAGRRMRQSDPMRDASDRLAQSMPVVRDSLSAAGRERLERWSRPPSVRGTRQHWEDLLLGDWSLSVQTLRPGVWWSDPLSDQEVLELAWQLPAEAWVRNGLDRGLARDAAAGLVPDYIRLRRTRGAQSADVGLWIAGREQRYRDEIDRFRGSSLVHEFLDVDRLERSLARGLPSGDDAMGWEMTFGRAFGFGLFAVWYEEEILKPARRRASTAR